MMAHRAHEVRIDVFLITTRSMFILAKVRRSAARTLRIFPEILSEAQRRFE